MERELVDLVKRMTTLNEEEAVSALKSNNNDVEATIKKEMEKFKQVKGSQSTPLSRDDPVKKVTNNQKVFNVFRKFLDEAENNKRNSQST